MKSQSPRTNVRGKDLQLRQAVDDRASQSEQTGTYDRIAAGRDLRHAHLLLLQRGSERSKAAC
jgi:hypothetical protein